MHRLRVFVRRQHKALAADSRSEFYPCRYTHAIQQVPDMLYGSNRSTSWNSPETNPTIDHFPPMNSDCIQWTSKMCGFVGSPREERAKLTDGAPDVGKIIADLPNQAI